MEKFITLTSLAVFILWLVPGWLARLRSSRISANVHINRETEPGETVTFQLNFFHGDSEEVMLERFQKIVRVAEARQKFCFDRFQKISEEQIKKNEEKNDKKALREA